MLQLWVVTRQKLKPSVLQELQREVQSNRELYEIFFDRIKQVSEILADRSDLTAVHFITHGADGQINLGN